MSYGSFLLYGMLHKISFPNLPMSFKIHLQFFKMNERYGLANVGNNCISQPSKVVKNLNELQ